MREQSKPKKSKPKRIREPLRDDTHDQKNEEVAKSKQKASVIDQSSSERKSDKKGILEDESGTFELVAGGSVGAIGAAGAIAGALCPLCVVGAPALIGYGIYKKRQYHKNMKKQQDK